MKILHIITDTNFGGAGQYLLYLLTKPAFNGVEVKVACPDGQLAARLESAGIDRIPISGKDTSFSFGLTLELLRLVKKTKPDIVHTHSCLSGRISAKLRRTPVVYTKHGQVRPVKGRLKKWFNGLVSAMLSDGIIAVSQKVYQELVASGVKSSKMVCVVNGVDVSAFAPKDTKPFAESGHKNNIVVGTAARLDPVKAIDVLVDAARMVMNSLPQARFVIAGSGPMEDSLRARIQNARLEPYVKMVGFVEDMRQFLSELDIFVLCSRQEGLGLSALQAMAAGLPVVATEVGGLPEVVVHDETGFLVPPGDVKFLAQAIVRLAIDPDMAAQMGTAGRNRAEEVFDSVKMAERTMDLYHAVLN